jgi:hypothetical protein
MKTNNETRAIDRENVEIAQCTIDDLSRRFKCSINLEYNESAKKICKINFSKEISSLNLDKILSLLNYYISPIVKKKDEHSIAEHFVNLVKKEYDEITIEIRFLSIKDFSNRDYFRKNNNDIVAIFERKKTLFIKQYGGSYPSHLTDSNAIQFCINEINFLISEINKF